MGGNFTGRRRAAGALLAAGLVSGLISGCSTPSQASSTAPSSTASAPSAAPGSASPSATGQGSAAGAGVDTAAAYRKWGIEPLAAPPAPPAKKPVTLRPGSDVPVISEIPTQDKVVFITVDDGAEKDPEFVTMMSELKIPFTMFLTDAAISSDYGYFERLQRLGNGVQNHTLTHPNLRTLGPAAQKREICGQQNRLKRHYGTTPRLFRPPYGNWNEGTRAAAKACGVEAIVLWRESMQIKNMQYQRGDRKLHPGDIILAHFRGPSDLKGRTMTEMTANMLRRIQEQGFTVARLEDYL
ncbi:polysaccharide deacetylase family protein [Streptomyces sp. NPDC059909]|uniref:polysaccharide deacetylase family protein n=1 Tax=Streptomyces sp. NPDC059909 TaxID=3346998 RepID=UPI003657BBD8